jgi:hypothetical protein
MTDIGGTRPVYAPVTPSVDNNAKPSAGPVPGAVGHGVLNPGPNVTWVEKVAGKDVTKMGWRQVQVSQKALDQGQSDITIGASEARVAHGLVFEAKQLLGKNPTIVTEQESTLNSGTSSPATVEDVQKSSKKSLDDEAKHDEQVARAKNEDFQRLLDADKLRAKADQLDIPGGTAPAA